MTSSMHLSTSLLFVVLLALQHSCENNQFVNAFSAPVFTSSRVAQNAQRQFDGYQRTSSSLWSSAGQDEAERLLEKARKVREELALLEGKSLSQVEEEAKVEKESRKAIIESNISSSGTSKSNKKRRANSQVVYVPETIDDQIRQAAYAIERAFQDNITRQTVRLALVKKDEPITAEEEEWPGGAKQMYREAGRPLTEALLSEVRAVAKNLQSEEEKNSGKEMYPPEVKAQDIWDFDGSALITAEAASGPSGDVQALVFPNTDSKYLKDIAEIDSKLGKDRLFLLINPFWRNVESWGFNILQPKAKQKAQETIFDNENGAYQETYVLSRFSVRGEDCVALKVYPNDWELFAYLEDYSFGGPVQTTIRLGTSEDEPTSAIFAKYLNEREEFKMNKTMRQLNRKF
mmetsp:Transcript_16904/g.25258  ORF Transcript_16904/g.25258 Transcript_16904/m.25258 type:complete len:403 (-) Transcript_16904:137-1345(-)